MSYDNVKSFRMRLKERAVYVLGGSCQLCGYNKSIQALDFHHVNPQEKKFNFNDNANRSWFHTRNEIAKCVLLCANCHREVHAGLIPLEELDISFSEEKALEIDQMVNDLKTHKIIFCKDCGKEISRNAERCPECSAKIKQIVERPSKEDLEELLYNNNGNFSKVSKIFNVSDNAVRKWCKKYNLESHSSYYKQKQ